MVGFVFDDRHDAGKQLGRALEAYRGKQALVLAIPRGGVVVGHEVARHLDADFSMIVARKLPFPDNPEAGFGAIAEDGSTFLFPEAQTWLTQDEIARIIAAQKKETARRVNALRGGRPLPEIAGRTVILVDDGIAMGSTMRAAILTCRNRKAGRLVVAAPVAGPDVAEELRDLADEVVVLVTPSFFRAVAQVYREWYDLSDAEVIEIMALWEKEKSRTSG
ncbi:MAG: phosphoribosyltransferase [Candidatus Sumerlaeia bacterium]|nr:phosphoribosyltransferase [Candidatus Sumerlaeia bacterium]